MNASAKKKVVEVRSRVVYKHTTSKIYKKANKKMVSAVSSLQYYQSKKHRISESCAYAFIFEYLDEGARYVEWPGYK